MGRPRVGAFGVPVLLPLGWWCSEFACDRGGGGEEGKGKEGAGAGGEGVGVALASKLPSCVGGGMACLDDLSLSRGVGF